MLHLLRKIRQWLTTSKRSQTNKPRPPLLFLHIPKTAGSSVNEFLVNRFALNDLHSIYPAFTDDATKLLPSEPKSCYAGHVRYDIKRYLPKNTRIFTILRDPIDRALSAYFFYLRIPREELLRGGPYIANIQNMSFPEYVKTYPDSAISTFGNYQTYYFSREYSTDRHVQCRRVTRCDLDIAKKHLSECIVGLTDHLHESLVLLCHEYDWPYPDRVSEANKTTNRPRTLDAESQAWLEEHTRLDAELFCFARELFHERWARLNQQSSVRKVASARRNFRLTFDQPIPGYGWHPRETHQLGPYCFLEPHAWLECPRIRGRQVRVEVRTVPMLPQQLESPILVRANGVETRLERHQSPDGSTYEAILPAGDQPTFRLEFQAIRPVRPAEVLPGNQDKRLLSLAVREVLLRTA